MIFLKELTLCFMNLYIAFFVVSILLMSALNLIMSCHQLLLGVTSVCSKALNCFYETSPVVFFFFFFFGINLKNQTIIKNLIMYKFLVCCFFILIWFYTVLNFSWPIFSGIQFLWVCKLSVVPVVDIRLWSLPVR